MLCCTIIDIDTINRYLFNYRNSFLFQTTAFIWLLVNATAANCIVLDDTLLNIFDDAALDNCIVICDTRIRIALICWLMDIGETGLRPTTSTNQRATL